MAKKPGKAKSAKAAKPAEAKDASAKTIKADRPEKPRSAAERVAQPIKQAGQRVREGTGKAVQNTVAINTKVIEHAEANAREAFAAMRRAAEARSLQEVLQVQTQFVKEQGARTATQAREVGELIASFGRDALNLVRGK